MYTKNILVMMIKKYAAIFFLTDKIRFVIITRNYDKSGTVESTA